MAKKQKDRCSKIRLVVLDADGVLTDGGITWLENGGETSRFSVRDGMGIRLMLDAGLAVGIISGRDSPAVRARARELGMSFVHQGVADKWATLSRELQERGISSCQTAFMGDDLNDLSLLGRVGFSAAPRNAAREVKKRVDWVASARGGHGAVRLLAERLLKAAGLWRGILDRFQAMA